MCHDNKNSILCSQLSWISLSISLLNLHVPMRYYIGDKDGHWHYYGCIEVNSYHCTSNVSTHFFPGNYAPDDNQVPVFLSLIGSKAYSLLRKLSKGKSFRGFVTDTFWNPSHSWLLRDSISINKSKPKENRLMNIWQNYAGLSCTATLGLFSMKLSNIVSFVVYEMKVPRKNCLRSRPHFSKSYKGIIRDRNGS